MLPTVENPRVMLALANLFVGRDDAIQASANTAIVRLQRQHPEPLLNQHAHLFNIKECRGAEKRDRNRHLLTHIPQRERQRAMPHAQKRRRELRERNRDRRVEDPLTGADVVEEITPVMTSSQRVNFPMQLMSEIIATVEVSEWENLLDAESLGARRGATRFLLSGRSTRTSRLPRGRRGTPRAPHRPGCGSTTSPGGRNRAS